MTNPDTEFAEQAARDRFLISSIIQDDETTRGIIQGSISLENDLRTAEEKELKTKLLESIDDTQKQVLGKLDRPQEVIDNGTLIMNSIRDFVESIVNRVNEEIENGAGHDFNSLLGEILELEDTVIKLHGNLDSMATDDFFVLAKEREKFPRLLSMLRTAIENLSGGDTEGENLITEAKDRFNSIRNHVEEIYLALNTGNNGFDEKRVDDIRLTENALVLMKKVRGDPLLVSAVTEEKLKTLGELVNVALSEIDDGNALEDGNRSAIAKMITEITQLIAGANGNRKELVEKEQLKEQERLEREAARKEKALEKASEKANEFEKRKEFVNTMIDLLNTEAKSPGRNKKQQSAISGIIGRLQTKQKHAKSGDKSNFNRSFDGIVKAVGNVVSNDPKIKDSDAYDDIQKLLGDMGVSVNVKTKDVGSSSSSSNVVFPEKRKQKIKGKGLESSYGVISMEEFERMNDPVNRRKVLEGSINAGNNSSINKKELEALI